MKPQLVIFMLWFLYGFDKRDMTCLLVIFRGAVREVLLVSERAMLAVSLFPVFMLIKANCLLAVGFYLLYRRESLLMFLSNSLVEYEKSKHEYFFKTSSGCFKLTA